MSARRGFISTIICGALWGLLFGVVISVKLSKFAIAFTLERESQTLPTVALSKRTIPPATGRKALIAVLTGNCAGMLVGLGWAVRFARKRRLESSEKRTLRKTRTQGRRRGGDHIQGGRQESCAKVKLVGK